MIRIVIAAQDNQADLNKFSMLVFSGFVFVVSKPPNASILVIPDIDGITLKILQVIESKQKTLKGVYGSNDN